MYPEIRAASSSPTKYIINAAAPGHRAGAASGSRRPLKPKIETLRARSVACRNICAEDTLSMTHRKFFAAAAFGALALSAAPLARIHASQQQQAPLPAAQDPAAARVAALKSATDGTLGTIGEIHLRNIRQVTFGGQNAEAYFSADDKQL